MPGLRLQDSTFSGVLSYAADCTRLSVKRAVCMHFLRMLRSILWNMSFLSCSPVFQWEGNTP